MRPPDPEALETAAGLLAGSFRWAEWDALLSARGVVVERARRSRHPRHPDIIYPIDYGYVEGTVGTDGEAVDVFVGTGAPGLVALAVTDDARRGDREAKLLWACTPEEVYLVHGFLNYAPHLMQGRLAMRRPMAALWGAGGVFSGGA